MTEPSSQKPSDPDKRPDNDDASPPKLKLKQLLTPISPHLKIKHSKEKEEAEQFKPKMEIPKAVPIDPEPELQPHEKPPPQDVKSSPLATQASDKEFPGAHVADPQAPQIRATEPAPQPAPESIEQQPEPTLEEEARPKSTVAVKKKQKSGKSKKVILSLVAVLLILAGIQYFIDPLGISSDPVATQPTVINRAAPAASVTNKTIAPQSPEKEPVTVDVENLSVDSFIQKLKEQEVTFIDNPRGIIINAVFYPEGSILNPQLNLVVESINQTDKSTTIFIEDNSGNRYQLAAN